MASSASGDAAFRLFVLTTLRHAVVRQIMRSDDPVAEAAQLLRSKTDAADRVVELGLANTIGQEFLDHSEQFWSAVAEEVEDRVRAQRATISPARRPKADKD